MIGNLFGRSRQGRRRPPLFGTRLHLELLETRDLPSTFNLTPLVQVSGPSPFLGNPVEANDPPSTIHLEFEPYLAVNPTNLNHLVGAWTQDFNRGIVAGISFNGGNTWQSVVIPGISLTSGGIYPFAFHPWVSFAPNGDVYVSAGGTEANGEFPKAALVSKSTDGGLTWGTPTTFVAGNNDFHAKASITADPTNSEFAYAVWTRFHGGKGTTMFSRTTDGGQTWEPAREIVNGGSNDSSRANQIVVLPDGTLVCFFAQLLHKNNTGGLAHFDYKLSLTRSSDHGQTWLPENTPIAVADILPLDDTQTVPVPNPDGGLDIQALNWVFDVAVDAANGNLYAVWQDARFSHLQYNSIAFAMSADGGFTWSTPIKINQTPDSIPLGNRQAFLPSVAVNQDGVVAVTYYDFRNNAPDPGLPTDVWMVHAHPGDFTNWSSENRMTLESFNMEVPAPKPDGYFVGDYQGLVAMGQNFGAFWAMPPGPLPPGTDQSSIFFRDPLAAESTAELEAHGHHSEFRDVSSLHGIDMRAADLGGRTLGLASGHTIWLDANAAGWGWSVEPTPWHDSKFTTPGTAKTREDYIAKTGTLTFAPGETTKTITIEVKGDDKTEGNETLFLDLFGNSGNSLFTKNRGLSTILNDD